MEADVAGLSSARLARIGDYLERNFIEPGKIAGCQALVARRGQVAYRVSLGTLDRARERLMRDDAIFRIYSMTKPVTSLALMQLYERGLFQLNEPVARVIPAFGALSVYESGSGPTLQTRKPKQPMTFRQLLNHSSGLTYAGFPQLSPELHPVDRAYQAARVGSRKDTLEQMVQKLAQLPLRYDPGERWLYSYSVDVCAYLVEQLSGQRFDHYLEEHVLGPLGLRDTSFRIAPDKLERFTACYRRGSGGELVLSDDPRNSEYAREPTFLAGGHGLLSTLSDYHRFCELLRRGGELDGTRLIGSRTLDLMTQNHLPGGRDLSQLALGYSETGNDGIGFGLGFATTLSEAAAGTYGAGDFFWGGMASTLFWVDPKEELVVIFLTQLIPSSTYDFRGPLKSLVYSSIVD
jgi:CubicO group peptidase (beta-lactamase class C family)